MMASITKPKMAPKAAEKLANLILDSLQADLDFNNGYGNYDAMVAGTCAIVISALRAQDGQKLRTALAFGDYLADDVSSIVFLGGDMPIPQKITVRWIIKYAGRSALSGARGRSDAKNIMELLAAGLPAYHELEMAIGDGFCPVVTALLDAGVEFRHAIPTLPCGTDRQTARAAMMTHPRFAIDAEALVAEFQAAPPADNNLHDPKGVFRSEILRWIDTGIAAPFAHLEDPEIEAAIRNTEFAKSIMNGAMNAPDQRHRNRTAIATI